MSDSNLAERHSEETRTAVGIESLRSSLYSLALSVNTILPQYSAAISLVSQATETPASFEQDIRGETYRFQVLTNQYSSIRRPAESSVTRTSSFHSDPALPPRYSTISSLQQRAENNDNLVVQHYEHSFTMQSKRPWATLHMFTPQSIPGMFRTSKRKPDVPVIYDGEPVLGMVELDIESPKAIEQISISLQGKISNGHSDVSTKILDLNYILWHKSKGAKLLGSHQLPFSFRVQNPSQDMLGMSTIAAQNTSVSPYEVRSRATSSSSKISPISTRLSTREKRHSAWSPRFTESNTRGPESDVESTTMPPSFNERGIKASIVYTLTVRIQRRLRSDSIIKTDISFVPSTIADASSSQRQMAYASGSVCPGPYQDPEGWAALPVVTIKGEVNDRPIEIECTLHLAEPRSYCRGTVIPCYLTFSSNDPHSFRLMSNPKMPLVRLVRRLLQFEPCHIQPQSSTLVTPFRDEGVEYNSFENVLKRSNIVALATWRPPPKDVLEQLDYNSYYLEGEIHLPEYLQPSHSSRLFTVEYYVELLPLFSNIFKNSAAAEATDKEKILLSRLVGVTTLRESGEPTPVTFSEPSVYSPSLFEEAPKEPEWNNQALEQFGLI